MCNIPWAKVENPHFRGFFEKYICKCKNEDRTIPSESLLRKKYLDQVYNDKMKIIHNEIENNKLWISLDETTDVMGRNVVNFLVKPLNKNVPGKTYLLNCKTLAVVNGRTVSELVIQCLNNLWGDQFNTKVKNVLILCTDSVAYMILAGKILKNTFPNMRHFTCLAHALHRLAETIRLNFGDVDTLINNAKKIFLKAPNRVRIFKELNPNIPLPPEPVITRWGTWLEAAFYYAQHLNEIETVVAILDSNEAISIRNTKEVLMKPNLKEDLNYIHEHFETLRNAITKLEKSDLPINEALEIFDEVRFIVNETSNKTLIEKMEKLMNRNPDFDFIREISETFNRNSDYEIYKFAPLTSVDVERSFSTYKWILNLKRNRLTEDNIEKIIVIFYNNKHKELNSDLSLDNVPVVTPSCSAQIDQETSDFRIQHIISDSD